MTSAFEFDQLGMSNQSMKRIAIHWRNEAIILSPHDQGWAVYTLETALKGWIIRWIPG
jgi:hypothetical protein